MNPDFDGAKVWAIGRMQTDLPPTLFYHNVQHTQSYVMVAALRLAQLSNMNETDTHLLEVAAAFHDIGFIESLANHEAHGVQIAHSILPRYDFDSEQIKQLCGAIWATKLPQTPRNQFESLLADADLSVLGSVNFWPLNNALRREFEATVWPISDYEWYTRQLQFLQSQRYFSDAAQHLYAVRKQQHIVEMRHKLERLSPALSSCGTY